MHVARSYLFMAIATAALVSSGAAMASAHGGHDERRLGTAQQSELRRGTHSLGDRRLGEDDDDGPSIGRGLNSGGGGLSDGGGLGGMRDGGHGNYGAGSLGERGPGGLGTLQGDSILRDHPRPR